MATSALPIAWRSSRSLVGSASAKRAFSTSSFFSAAAAIPPVAAAHMKPVQGLVGAIGNTPLIRLNRLSEEYGCNIMGKAEFMEPGGSVKVSRV